MYNLQEKLEQRLKALNAARKTGQDQVKGYDLSKESITRSLQEAGILDQKGDVIQRVKGD